MTFLEYLAFHIGKRHINHQERIILDTILVTGGCGFIGSHFIRYIRANGFTGNIHVIDDESRGSFEAIKEYDVTHFQGSILDQELLSNSLQNVDAVIHLVTDTSTINSVNDINRNFRVNVEGTFNLLTTMYHANVKRLINISVNDSFAKKHFFPSGCKQQDFIELSKTAMFSRENYCHAFTGDNAINTTTFQVSNVYGPGACKNNNLVAYCFQQIASKRPLTIHADDHQVNDLIYINDLIKIIWNNLNNDTFGTFQLSSVHPVKINSLIKEIESVVGTGNIPKIHYLKPETNKTQTTTTSYQPQRSKPLSVDQETHLQNGLKDTWNWFQKTSDKNESEAQPQFDLSVIFPIRNEESILKEAMHDYGAEFDRIVGKGRWQYVFMENRSSDRTPEILRELCEQFPGSIFRQDPRGNIGTALRDGMLLAKGSFQLIMNVDHLWDPPFMEWCWQNRYEHDMILGSKRADPTLNRQDFYRRFLSSTLNGLLNYFFDFIGNDTHGMKFMRTASVLKHAENCIMRRGQFDTELTLRSIRAGLRVMEVPIPYEEKRRPRNFMIKKISQNVLDVFRMRAVLSKVPWEGHIRYRRISRTDLTSLRK